MDVPTLLKSRAVRAPAPPEAGADQNVISVAPPPVAAVGKEVAAPPADARRPRRALFRLAAAAANSLMIVAVYLMYILGEWEELDLGHGCSGDLGLLETLNCSRRYSFSDSMLWGWNMEIFLIVGLPTAVVYAVVEGDRILELRALLAARRAAAEAAGDAGAASLWRRSLMHLDVHGPALMGAFALVLCLVPGHLGRPMLHYTIAGAAFSLMMVSFGSYVLMPLSHAAATDPLAVWGARRDRWISPLVLLSASLHVAAFAAGGANLLLRWEALGITFGVLEVAVILSYQAVVAALAVDDLCLDPAPCECPPGAKGDALLGARELAQVSASKWETVMGS